MGHNEVSKRFAIDQNRLPQQFPTHRHAAEFWEQLGRTIATFGFLERTLGRAIFAFTGTREYQPNEVEKAYEAWLKTLEHALTDQLHKLSESFERAVRENHKSSDEIERVQRLVADIQKAAKLRNALCHGSWSPPTADGKSKPYFVNRHKLVFDTEVDVAFLRQVQAHVCELACHVMDSVTFRGWRFPGSKGPGIPVF